MTNFLSFCCGRGLVMMQIGKKLSFICLVSLWLWACFSQLAMSDESEAEESSQYRSDYSSSETVVWNNNSVRFLIAMSQAIVSDNTQDHRFTNNVLTGGWGGAHMTRTEWSVLSCKDVCAIIINSQTLSWRYYCFKGPEGPSLQRTEHCKSIT